MNDNKVNDLLNETMSNIVKIGDVNTVIGDPITTPDGITIIPVSRVSYGFAAGGSDIPSKAVPPQPLFAGGSGAGVTISPIAFLTVSNGNVRMLQIEPFTSPVDRALELAPEVIEKISALLKKEDKTEKSAE